MSTLGEALSTATETLARAGIDTARLDAEVLLANALDSTRTGLFARLRESLAPAERSRFEARLERRRQREPLAYIVGGSEFWSLWFEVGPATLVPRPETELLVDIALESIATLKSPRVLDIGTGSGCIAVAIAHERRDAQVTAIDISAEALQVARGNAERHGIAGRIDFQTADVRDFVSPGGYDVIVANPPYISTPAIETLQPEVRRWEPRAALDGGEDGLALVRAVLAVGRDLLLPTGRMAIEIGSDQRDEAIALARSASYGSACVRLDYAGLPRVLLSMPLTPQVDEVATRRGLTTAKLPRT